MGRGPERFCVTDEKVVGSDPMDMHHMTCTTISSQDKTGLKITPKVIGSEFGSFLQRVDFPLHDQTHTTDEVNGDSIKKYLTPQYYSNTHVSAKPRNQDSLTGALCLRLIPECSVRLLLIRCNFTDDHVMVLSDTALMLLSSLTLQNHSEESDLLWVSLYLFFIFIFGLPCLCSLVFHIMTQFTFISQR